MKIDKKLNLVIPIEYETGTIYAHSTPLESSMFEANYLLLSKTFSAIYGEGLSVTVGPRVAMLILRDVAKRMDIAADVESGLIAEIKRMTMVAVPGEKGWETIPYDEAVSKGRIDATDASEVENAIAFFIVASAVHKRSEVEEVLTKAARLWGGLTTSLNSTEYAASLPSLIATVSSGEKAA